MAGHCWLVRVSGGCRAMIHRFESLAHHGLQTGGHVVIDRVEAKLQGVDGSILGVIDVESGNNSHLCPSISLAFTPISS